MWQLFVPEPEPFMTVIFIQTKVTLLTKALQEVQMLWNCTGQTGTECPFLFVKFNFHTSDIPEYLWFGQIPNPLQVCKELLIFRFVA